jgi:O-glycosyl hydrolase
MDRDPRAASLLRALVFFLSVVSAAVLVVDAEIVARPVRASGASVARGPEVVASIDPLDPHRLVGIGASGAWWSVPAYELGPRDRRRIGQLLYGRHGLELSQFRFNIGGGGVGVSTWWKAPQSFYLGNGRFDFALDRDAVWFLRQAARLGVRDLVGFVNSAPPEFTSNHRSCGGVLRGGDVAAYALELAETVRGIATHLGVRLAYVSPMNEPSGSQPACRQEGMAVPVALRGPLVVDLARDLRRLAPWCRVIADEASFVSHFLRTAPRWLSYPGARAAVAALAVHGYDYPTKPTLARLHAFALALHHQVWATEICCHTQVGFAYRYDPTMTSGMWLANTIYNDLMIAGASAFDWWIALSPDLGCNPVANPGCPYQVNPLGRNDGLIYFDLHGASDGDRNLYLTKRYFVLGNFSRYLRPGALLYQVRTSDPRVEVIAAVRGSTEVIVAIDRTPAGAPLTPLLVELPAGSPPLAPIAAVETSPTRSLAPVALPTVAGRAIAMLSPPESVTTYVFRRR